MNTLNLSHNIIRLRRRKKITQEQLAEFIGVTKASVSKWETRQSLPDILILPALAAFFDVTIDELLGYEPQLSKEQIQKIYRDLAADFAQLPFEDVMERSRELVKKYYSCYPFLFQMSTLWLNHVMLAESRERQTEILASISELCGRIASDCREIGLAADAVILKASVDMQLGHIKEVVETLEEVLNPQRLSNQSDSLLIQAYRLAGQADQANGFTQVSMFTHLLSLTGSATQYLAIHSGDLGVCEQTMQRIDRLIEAYRLETLHPNSAALFHCQAAIVYSLNGKAENAIARLERYAFCIGRLLENDIMLRGDSYFDGIESWFEQLDMGRSAPRDRKVILDSAVQVLEHPAFADLRDTADYRRIKRSLSGKGAAL
ncbi:helix-turn-helix transcriptional regulator [Saccharibacillus sp. CPCC 101409]|uniref:helix-turn-helix domain-containing protein n=1 Tax=Saccharibacillus sp. CPCC 101409 TaxID=3058041 RepID=UPI002673DE82|nr:helix-turn-helix transcriptional regulator [Saccharibacillus sp. CPCC 101409]MDO3410339.1 helix-turn-helix transcriptional regulator [Saccharibacillus sp. CPCC 101409]